MSIYSHNDAIAVGKCSGRVLANPSQLSRSHIIDDELYDNHQQIVSIDDGTGYVGPVGFDETVIPVPRNMFALINNGGSRFSIADTSIDSSWTFASVPSGAFGISKVGVSLATIKSLKQKSDDKEKRVVAFEAVLKAQQ